MEPSRQYRLALQGSGFRRPGHTALPPCRRGSRFSPVRPPTSHHITSRPLVLPHYNHHIPCILLPRHSLPRCFGGGSSIPGRKLLQNNPVICACACVFRTFTQSPPARSRRQRRVATGVCDLFAACQLPTLSRRHSSRWANAQFTSALTCGSNDCPSSVRQYSTRGGTSGYTVRLTRA